MVKIREEIKVTTVVTVKNGFTYAEESFAVPVTQEQAEAVANLCRLMRDTGTPKVPMIKFIRSMFDCGLGQAKWFYEQA